MFLWFIGIYDLYFRGEVEFYEGRVLGFCSVCRGEGYVYFFSRVRDVYIFF